MGDQDHDMGSLGAHSRIEHLGSLSPIRITPIMTLLLISGFAVGIATFAMLYVIKSEDRRLFKPRALSLPQQRANRISDYQIFLKTRTDEELMCLLMCSLWLLGDDAYLVDTEHLAVEVLENDAYLELEELSYRALEVMPK